MFKRMVIIISVIETKVALNKELGKAKLKHINIQFPKDYIER